MSDEKLAVQVALERIDELISYAKQYGHDGLAISLYRNRNCVLDIQRKLERLDE